MAYERQAAAAAAAAAGGRRGEGSLTLSSEDGGNGSRSSSWLDAGADAEDDFDDAFGGSCVLETFDVAEQRALLERIERQKSGISTTGAALEREESISSLIYPAAVSLPPMMVGSSSSLLTSSVTSSGFAGVSPSSSPPPPPPPVVTRQSTSSSFALLTTAPLIAEEEAYEAEEEEEDSASWQRAASQTVSEMTTHRTASGSGASVASSSASRRTSTDSERDQGFESSSGHGSGSGGDLVSEQQAIWEEIQRRQREEEEEMERLRRQFNDDMHHNEETSSTSSSVGTSGGTENVVAAAAASEEVARGAALDALLGDSSTATPLTTEATTIEAEDEPPDRSETSVAPSNLLRMRSTPVRQLSRAQHRRGVDGQDSGPLRSSVPTSVFANTSPALSTRRMDVLRSMREQGDLTDERLAMAASLNEGSSSDLMRAGAGGGGGNQYPSPWYSESTRRMFQSGSNDSPPQADKKSPESSPSVGISKKNVYDSASNLSACGTTCTSGGGNATLLEVYSGQHIRVVDRRSDVLKSDTKKRVTCGGCSNRFFVSATCKILYCPECETLTPTSLNSAQATAA